MQMKVTVKLAEQLIGESDVVILTANRITIANGIIMVKQIEDSLEPLDDFLAVKEEIVGVFKCEDVRCIYRTVSAR